MKLYQVEWCPQCHRVRQTLTELGLDYLAVNVAEDADERHDVVAVSGQSEVPVLVDDERVVSGSEEIIEYLRATYPPAPDAEAQAARGAWRLSMTTTLEPRAALAQLREALQRSGFTVVGETAGSQISDRLPDTYVLLQAVIPAAAVKAVVLDPTAVSAVALPLAVVPVEGGTAIVSANPVGQVWLFASPELRKVQAMVKKRLVEVFEQLQARV